MNSRLLTIVAVIAIALLGWRWSRAPAPPAVVIEVREGESGAPETREVTTATEASAGAPRAAAQRRRYEIEPYIEGYGRVILQGWSVRIARDLYEPQPELAQDALALLDRKLADIVAAVPADRVDELRAVPIWMSAQVEGLHGMQYHWSADWLREHGYNPAKARAVEIAEAATFINWEPDQPWFVLHELTHALHDRRLGENNERVLSAFHNAQARGLYQSVRRNNGQTGPAYALNNDKEYLAKLTEAYFGINDFYPFNRKDLRDYDPVGYAMVESVWLGR